jgi:hypothetical protein
MSRQLYTSRKDGAMVLDAAQASTLIAAHMGALPDGSTTLVSPVDGYDGFWSASVVNGLGMIEPGAFHLIAPDGRIWVGSSNPGIHDHALTLRVLSGLYEKGLANVVDQAQVMQRVRTLTEERDAAITALIAAARAGELRAATSPRLP